MNSKGEFAKDLTMKFGSGGVLLAIFKYIGFLKIELEQVSGKEARKLSTLIELTDSVFDKAL